MPDGEGLARLGWAPDGATFVATTIGRPGARTYVVARRGGVQERLAVDGVAFLADGRQMIARGNAVYLRSDGSEKRVISLDAVRAEAGFGRGALVAIGPDRHGFSRGYGRQAIAAVVYAGAQAQVAQAIVVIAANGQVRRAGPRFGSSRSGVPGGRAWAPGGETLGLVVGELPGSARLRLGHDHCFHRWSAHGGYRRVVCGSSLPHRGHFDRLVWSAHGNRVLLNNGTVINRAGKSLGRLAVAPLAFQLTWTE